MKKPDKNNKERIRNDYFSILQEIIRDSHQISANIKTIVLVDISGTFRSLSIEDWKNLELLAYQGLDLSAKNLGIIKINVESRQETETSENPQESIQAFVQEITQLANKYEEIVQESPEVAISIQNLNLTLLDQIPSNSNANSDFNGFYLSDKSFNLWVQAAKSTIGINTRCLLTLFFANFNQSYTSLEKIFKALLKSRDAQNTTDQTENDPAAIELKIHKLQTILYDIEGQMDFKTINNHFEGQILEFKKQLKDLQEQLYTSCRKNEPYETLEIHLNALNSWLLTNLLKFADLQARLNLFIEDLQHQGKNALSEQVGRIAANAWDMGREMVASYTATHVLKLQGVGMEIVDLPVKIIDFTAYKFSSPIPDGKLTKFTEINNAEAGQLIEIRGFVKEVEVFRNQANRLISRLILEDPSSNEKAVVEAIFIHLLHEGIGLGTYCIANGYNDGSLDYDGERIPRIKIDVLSVRTKLIQESWLMAFLNLSDICYERWPNNINLKFSLSAHRPQEEKLSSILGAAELGMKPLIKF